MTTIGNSIICLEKSGKGCLGIYSEVRDLRGGDKLELMAIKKKKKSSEGWIKILKRLAVLEAMWVGLAVFAWLCLSGLIPFEEGTAIAEFSIFAIFIVYIIGGIINIDILTEDELPEIRDFAKPFIYPLLLLLHIILVPMIIVGVAAGDIETGIKITAMFGTLFLIITLLDLLFNRLFEQNV